MNYELRIPFTTTEIGEDGLGGGGLERVHGYVLVKRHLDPDFATHLITAGGLARLDIELEDEWNCVRIDDVAFDATNGLAPVVITTDLVDFVSSRLKVEAWARENLYTVELQDE